MAGDPTGLLLGPIVGKLMQMVIDRLEKAIEWREYCRQLKQLLQSMGPLVAEITSHEAQEAAHASCATRTWLLDLKNCLEEAESVLKQCSDPKHRRNLFARSKSGSKLCQTTERIKDLLRTQTVVPIVDLLLQHMAATDAAFRELKQHLAQVALGLEGRNLLTSEVVDKERTVYMLSKGSERLGSTNPGSSTQLLFTGTGCTEEFNDQGPETQPIPQFVFGMERLNQQIQDVLLGSDEIAPDDGDAYVKLNPDSKWVGVWAKGGAGKTLLVQNAMNNPMVTAHFNNCVYAIVVGRSPDVIHLQRKLRDKIDGRKSWEINSPAEGRAKLFNLLRGKKCLLILDDVWREDDLSWFDVVSEVGGRILITSRNQTVLQRVLATELGVPDLSSENSLKLFCVHVFGGIERMPASLEKLVIDVVAECKGLPLALKVVGGFLAGKVESHLWEMALNNLRKAEKLSTGYEEQLFCRLKLSYDDLETFGQAGRVYKECFLYFAAFPEDAVIQAEHLIQLWVGDGLIGQEENLDPEIEAYSILSVLIGRSLIEIEKGWSKEQSATVSACKIHDVLRDMGLYILSGGTEPWEQRCLFKAGWEPSRVGTSRDVLPQGWLSFEDVDDRGQGDRGGCNIMQANKLSLMSSKVSSLPSKMPDGKDLTPPLRILLLRGCRHLPNLDGSFLGHFTNLRVLDLSYTSHIHSLPSAIRKLRQLVVLNLQSSAIQCLPQKIGELRELQYLNLQDCPRFSFRPGSRGLFKLVSLKYLNTRGCSLTWDTAVGMQQDAIFSQRWNCFTGEDSKRCCLEALNSLKDLKKLWLGSLDVEWFPERAMGKLSQLQLVSLYFPKLKALPDGMRNLREVEVLDLNSCQALEQLPGWVPESMELMKTLDLRGCGGLSQLPRQLGDLQELVKLDLSGCRSLQFLPDEFGSPGSFPSLQELWLFACFQLQAFPELQVGAFPRLLILSLFDCFTLRAVPQSIVSVGQHLRNLNLGGCRQLAMPNDETLAAFVKLEELSLKGLPIDVLPSAVASLPSLKKLIVTGCSELKTLPEPVIGSADLATAQGSSLYFPNLQELYAAKATSLTSIPVSIIELPKLKMLDVTGCDSLVVSVAAWKVIASRKRGLQVKGLVLAN